MSEDNIKRQIQQPWVSFGSDAAFMSAEGVFLKTITHPRAYGNFGETVDASCHCRTLKRGD